MVDAGVAFRMPPLSSPRVLVALSQSRYAPVVTAATSTTAASIPAKYFKPPILTRLWRSQGNRERLPVGWRAMTSRPATLGQLRDSGWQSFPVKKEIRRNAIAKIQAGEPLFPGVLGYEDTVLPQLENALLAGHDVIFLGERGQAKTRMIRSLIGLLDEWLPIVAGWEINDDPYEPISRHARDLVADRGEDTPIEWIHRDTR